MALQKRTSQAGKPRGGVLRGSFLGRSAPVAPTSHYRLESDPGLTDPGRAVPHGQPRSPAAAQPPQLLKPACAGLQHQSSTRSGANTKGKGAQSWADSQQNLGCPHGLCRGYLCPHSPYLLQRSSPDVLQGTHFRATEPCQTQPSRLLLQNWGVDLPLDKHHDSHGAKRRPHPASSLGSGHPHANHTPIKGTATSTLRKDTAGIYTKQPSHRRYQTHTATQGCAHIKTALQDHSR